MKEATQRGIWVPTQHLLQGRGKPRKTLLELASRRAFRLKTDFWPACNPALNTRTLTLVPVCLLLYLKKSLHVCTSLLTVFMCILWMNTIQL
jgi:hypothetical protein